MALANRRGGHPVSHAEFLQGSGGTRHPAQADRVLYQGGDPAAAGNQPNLTLFQQAVDDLLLDGNASVV